MFHRLTTAALGLAAVLLWPRPGAAQPSPLTLEEALARARQRAPALLEAADRVAEAQGRVAGAAPMLRDNPTLEAEAGPRTLADGSHGPNVSVGLSQPFELGGKRGARRDSARAALASATSRRRDVERQVLGEVAASFLRALHARERLRLARAAQESAQDILQVAQRRFEAGDVPVVDANVARVALARARASVAGVEGEEAARLGELRALLALPVDAALEVTGDLNALARQSVELPESPPERPDITALGEELEEAKAELRLAQAAAWPDVSLGVRYEREANETAIVGGISVPLPLFSRGQQGRETGTARVRLLEQALESARHVRDAQVGAARGQYRKNLDALETLEREALPLLAENESLARKSYEAGEMGLAEFLLVRRDVLDARADYLDRQLEAALSRAHLAAQVGVLR